MTNFLPLTGLQLPVKVQEQNSRRWNSSKHVTTCFLCNRPLTEQARDKGWFVHMSTGCELIPNDADVDADHGSQGLFPVGSECAKRIPITHRRRW